jgi:hypothetical protein
MVWSGGTGGILTGGVLDDGHNLCIDSADTDMHIPIETADDAALVCCYICANVLCDTWCTASWHVTGRCGNVTEVVLKGHGAVASH